MNGPALFLFILFCIIPTTGGLFVLPKLGFVGNRAYTMTNIASIGRPLTIKSSSNQKPTAPLEKKLLFKIKNTGILSLEGLVFGVGELFDGIVGCKIGRNKYFMG